MNTEDSIQLAQERVTSYCHTASYTSTSLDPAIEELEVLDDTLPLGTVSLLSFPFYISRLTASCTSTDHSLNSCSSYHSPLPISPSPSIEPPLNSSHHSPLLISPSHQVLDAGGLPDTPKNPSVQNCQKKRGVFQVWHSDAEVAAQTSLYDDTIILISNLATTSITILNDHLVATSLKLRSVYSSSFSFAPPELTGNDLGAIAH